MVKTLVEDAYGRVRWAILMGRHEPGSRLPTTELCGMYHTSAGVLREVLTRLVGDGLVISEPQRGFRVCDVSVEDLQRLTEARVMIEPVVLKHAIESGDVAWEARVVAALHTLLHTARDEFAPSQEWLTAHIALHEELLSAAPNARLRSIAASLRDATEIYRFWSNRAVPQHRDVDSEHKELVEATLAGDITLATTRLVQHIELGTQILLANQRNLTLATPGTTISSPVEPKGALPGKTHHQG
jgi:DNA-binding GntR family transcriptional regulator